jgi:hypothetical protein
MSDEKVQRVSELLHGRPPTDETMFLAFHMKANGLVDIWISEKVARTLSAGLAGELVDMLRDFLGDFVRNRG